MHSNFGLGDRDQVLPDQPMDRGLAPGGVEVTTIRVLHFLESSAHIAADRLKSVGTVALAKGAARGAIKPVIGAVLSEGPTGLGILLHAERAQRRRGQFP
jgi:hypothetical protein